MLDIIKNIEAAMYVNFFLSFFLRETNISGKVRVWKQLNDVSCIIYGYDKFYLWYEHYLGTDSHQYLFSPSELVS